MEVRRLRTTRMMTFGNKLGRQRPEQGEPRSDRRTLATGVLAREARALSPSARRVDRLDATTQLGRLFLTATEETRGFLVELHQRPEGIAIGRVELDGVFQRAPGALGVGQCGQEARALRDTAEGLAQPVVVFRLVGLDLDRTRESAPRTPEILGLPAVLARPAVPAVLARPAVPAVLARPAVPAVLARPAQHRQMESTRRRAVTVRTASE
jgi:hypothetical protein